MWEEDPRWQRSNYRLLVWSVAIGLAGSFLISLLSGDWQLFGIFLQFLGVILAALCIYATMVWTVGHLAVKLWSVVKKWSHKYDTER
jgi:hypothetical protein